MYQEYIYYILLHVRMYVKYVLITSQVDEKGQINSLSTVLSQEVDRFNNLLKVLKVQTSMGVYVHIYIPHMHIRPVLLIGLQWSLLL